MADRTRRWLNGLEYTLEQTVRVSNYLGQTILGNLALGREPSGEEKKQLASPRAVLADLKLLFERDWQNIQAGLYRVPRPQIRHPLNFAMNTLDVFRDLRRVRRRQAEKNVRDFSDEVPAEAYPKYYAQTFHFQTDGYLSERSARLYDHQVEMVFAGGAAAMRRQVYLPVREFLRASAQPVRELSLLDVACGTGSFLSFVKLNEPELHVTGLDLSPWYLKQARENLREESRADFVEANAEAIPFRDASFDVVTNIFLFHELPRRVREIVAREMFRVLKPGGLLVFSDSLQSGDKPSFDASLEYFPKNYHEPYYADFIKQDLRALFESVGFSVAATDIAFFSKILVLRKPA
ncbi:MAG: methyltransferase domain-containing protein [Bdellovibrionales bacterium]|nr:methyltransferase domain-containing protein [Bdellovibrionales bacterium]